MPQRVKVTGRPTPAMPLTRRQLVGLAGGAAALASAAATAASRRERDAGHYARLLGVVGSRNAVRTPAALLDLDALERNLVRMQQAVARQKIALRPHVKMHKSSLLARRQIAAGAIGVSCATLGETEAMCDRGIESILITSPMPTPQKMSRVRAVHERTREVLLVIDSLEGLAAAEAAFVGAARPGSVLIDIDFGDQRTGMVERAMITEALDRLAASRVLRLRGFQGYSGASQHAVGRAQRLAILKRGMPLLEAGIALARERKLDPSIVSGGGTGTYDVLGEAGSFTELQAGSYLVMDEEYNQVWRAASEEPPFETALFIQVTVVSRNHPGFVTTDGGKKRFATDAGAPAVIRGVAGPSTYQVWGDEHGKLSVSTPEARPAIGTRVECNAPHCDPTINLYEVLIGVRGETLVEVFKVDARVS